MPGNLADSERCLSGESRRDRLFPPHSSWCEGALDLMSQRRGKIMVVGLLMQEEGIASHHTKDKGDLGVCKVIADLIQNGIYSCIPISEHLPFDLVAVSAESELRRIQVKYRSLSRYGTISIDFRNTYSDRNGSHKKAVDRSSFDCYALYCPETDTVYYVRNDEISPSIGMAFALRVLSAKNNQRHRVNMASDYEGALRVFGQRPRSSTG